MIFSTYGTVSSNVVAGDNQAQKQTLWSRGGAFFKYKTNLSIQFSLQNFKAGI